MSALQFLNKKSWHPATIKNNEKVWKAEQKTSDENKRIAELQKQLVEERERESLRNLQIEAGHVPHGSVLDAKGNRVHRIDWMYEVEGPAQAGGPEGGPDGMSMTAMAKEKQEEFLLGTRDATELIARKQDLNKSFDVGPAAVEKVTKDSSLFDMEAKMRDDPLMAIKIEEKRAMEAIRSNPVMMAQLRKNARARGSVKREASPLRPEDDRKEAKRKRKEERDRIRAVRREKKSGSVGEIEADDGNHHSKRAKGIRSSEEVLDRARSRREGHIEPARGSPRRSHDPRDSRRYRVHDDHRRRNRDVSPYDSPRRSTLDSPARRHDDYRRRHRYVSPYDSPRMHDDYRRGNRDVSPRGSPRRRAIESPRRRYDDYRHRDRDAPPRDSPRRPALGSPKEQRKQNHAAVKKTIEKVAKGEAQGSRRPSREERERLLDEMRQNAIQADANRKKRVEQQLAERQKEEAEYVNRKNAKDTLSPTNNFLERTTRELYRVTGKK